VIVDATPSKGIIGTRSREESTEGGTPWRRPMKSLPALRRGRFLVGCRLECVRFTETGDPRSSDGRAVRKA
jgi:hypothetical protein